MSNASRNAIRAALHQLIGDKFEVREWIGGGGMAEVFLARHRMHGAYFAVKVLSEQLAEEPAIVARFMDEARTAATLSGHPNIAPVFDIGEAGSLHYIVMPYIEGEDLRSYLERRGRLSEAEAVTVVRQVAEALVWAGERQVVHRDLKPANIRIDLSGRVLVIDFGIAKAGDAPSARTRAGEALGTPYYMSPEQIRAERCDQRSDLYSLGVIFFELLSGAKPFTGDSYRAIEIGHTQKLPPALSTIAPDVDPELERIVNRLLEKERERRYQTAGELLDDLRRSYRGEWDARLHPVADRPLVGGEPGLAEAETMVTPVPPAAAPAGIAVKEEKKKGRGGVLAAAALAVVAVAAVGGYFVTRNQGAGEPKKETGAAKSLAPVIQDANGSMFLVAAGPFVFGSDDAESPNKKQTVELPAFYVDATEVSCGQYVKFAETTGRGGDLADMKKDATLPATGVTAEDARAYCAWTGKRLPDEREWEKAARGADGRVYPWGNQALASPGRLVAVDEYPERQSPSRALGMSGNAFEWTSTAFPVTEMELADMKKAMGGATEVSRDWLVIKGGSFLIKDERFFRLYMRRGWPSNQPNLTIGFRCVKDAN